ncbi:MAG: bifunctional folylpolyglutamate synthase/dihydrofolate synthase [Candidatus Nanopelagicales bacterium]|nr:bifunctional folylpolyglutamate synthase/dihydrofolate synthase [Candidatus Nanopelagicales bacterium]MCF8539021.1 bifunctional folylpolyglutamate synthase/dihydrofolate synthase [Candidatus Nanopelagicales bacterium]MCF8551185.1 bifunctional folylpolyglutamate synthase/dihydrofolate synthase [Candidatus Nanopelagicales bacterium]
MAVTDIDQLWRELEARWPENILEPSLTRMASVAELLDNPQLTYPVIQIAGTNGKSSTARMVESLLRSFGLRTGLFTSPHLTDPRERICLNGEPIPQERVLETWNEIAPFIDVVDRNSVADGGPPLSYFEALTILAYSVFADAPVDVAIMEVGLGGGWDATSICVPAVAVITPVDLDHQDYLGETIELIASEKAGIIARASAAVLGPQHPDAARVLVEACAQAGVIPARFAVEFGINSQDLAVGGQLLSLKGLRGEYPDIFLPLWGEHQGVNAATALAACESFLGAASSEPLDRDVVQEGFATTVVPGRLHIIRTGPTVLVDVAHNPHGARSLRGALETSFDFRGVIGVVGILADKDATGFLEELAPVIQHLVVTEPHSTRALPAADLARIARGILGDNAVSIAHSPGEALDHAIALADQTGEYSGTGVVVTGSVVLVGDVLRAVGGVE